ncbi:retrovirus-related pol polyprotein from transposon TNT 1-94 [Tanacetum coccineum]|uniref:Retrovirus-related pol polyprotein from transposon TNT 1-94 n=1 Tax=Tanacetum coccineum TaxID=301880 RepID=A0ABQ5HMW1_9ASTR
MHSSRSLHSTTITIPAVLATNDTPSVPEQTTVETILTMSPENKAHYESEKEAIHLLLTGIRDEIYLTVDACKTSYEMWIAIERLQQGESLNIQDVKTNLFWEFGKFTSHEGESMDQCSVSLTTSTIMAKQYQKEVNEIRAERIAKNANPLALIAKPITPPSKSASKEDSFPEQAQKDKDTQKKNQRTVTVVRARETVGSQVVQQTGIQCFNYKEFGHFAKECRKPKRVKDSTYHKEKMLLCKQAEKAKIQEVHTADSGTDSKSLEQVQYDAGYNVFANERQHSEEPESTSNTCLVEKDDSNVIPDSPDMCDNDIQTDQNAEDERVALANLIANLKIDVDENKKIQKTLGESNSIRDSCLIALQNKQTELEKYMAFNDRTVDYDKLEQLVDQAWVKHSHDHFHAPTALDMEVLIKTCLMPLATKTQNDSFTFFHELNQEMHADLKYVESLENEIDELESDKAEFSNMYDILLIPKPSVLGKPTPFSDSLERKSFSQTKSIPKTNVSEGLSKPVTTQIFPQTARQAIRNTNVIKPGMCKIDTRTTQTRAPQLPQTSRNTNPRVSTSTRVIHNTNVSRPQLRSTQMKDKVVPNNSQVKDKKTEVEDHPRISSISNKTKSVTACNDSLKSRTSNVNAVCATCGKCVINSNHDTCVSKFLNDVNTRTKKPKVVPISTRKPKSQVKKYVATPPKETIVILFIVDSGCTKHMTGNLTVYYVEGLNHNLFSVGQFYDADLEVAFQKSMCFVRDLQGNDLLTGNRGSDLYTISIQEMTSSTPIYLMAKALPTQAWLWHRRLSYLNFDYINLLSKKDVVIGLPKLKYVKDQLCSSCEVSKAKRSSFKTKVVPSSKGRLNLLHMTYVVQCGGTEFLNKTLHAFFKEKGIEHQTFTPRTPEQNGAVERRNRTLVEVARTMLSASKLPLFFWAKAIATACYTQNRSIIIPTHEKTAYHIINDRKPSIRHLHIFGCTCYLTRDGENLDKMKEKGDSCILMSKASDYDNSGPVPQLQNVSPSADTTAPSQQELDLLLVLCTMNFSMQEAIDDSAWIEAMQEELHQFDRLQVWELIDKPFGKNIIKLKWPSVLLRYLKHGMEKGQSIGIPMDTKPKLDADLSGKLVDQTDYRNRLKNTSKRLKGSFEYLRGTINMGLWYPKDSGFELTAFSDADHARYIDTCKSTSGGIQFLAEAEYVALSASCAQVIWMQTQLKDYGLHTTKSHEQVENGIIELYFFKTEYQLADMFTKALPEYRFQYLVKRMNLLDISSNIDM